MVVFGVPGSAQGEGCGACVVGSATENELENFLRNSSCRPGRCRGIGVFWRRCREVNARGKLSRAELQEKLIR